MDNQLSRYHSSLMGLIGFFVLVLAGFCGSVTAALQETITPDAKPKQENWAEQFLADDPLSAKTTVTLEELQSALSDPKRRGAAVARHFAKLIDVSQEEQVAYLRQLLESEFPEVQLQAAKELAARDELVGAVRDRLITELRSDQPSRREAAVVGLSRLALPPTELPAEYSAAIEELLAAEQAEVSAAAADELKRQGLAAVPSLLRMLGGDQPRTQRLAAKLLAELAREAAGQRSGEVPAEAGPQAELIAEEPLPPTVAKSAAAAEVARSIREPDAVKPKTVTVYYGTNRVRLVNQPLSLQELIRYPVLMAILLAALGFSFLRLGKEPAGGCGFWLLSLVLLVGLVWSGFVLRDELDKFWRIDQGPDYGPHHSELNQIYYGTCEVSIPPCHVVGELERPPLGRENEQQHVIIKKTEELEEDAYFNLLRERLEQLPPSDRSCFVFIHGFNVSFANAARRTAQIHYDLKFKGLPIFFSWPSRGSIRHYFSDRNEIPLGSAAIKRFLLEISQRIKADRIHVIAHSMGADATCQAIAELGERGKIFDQIILAAPDIDRDVFRLELAPQMAAAGQRTTLYCSKNDLALIASKAFNDGPRAGDSSRGALVAREIDTVDASGIDTDLLGHSYYGDCLPLLEDVQKLLTQHLPPAERLLKPWPVDEQLLYWTLPENSGQQKSAAPSPLRKETPGLLDE
jgi:esterase/lipase superfamily enzyme